jgi:hypothetical protein
MSACSRQAPALAKVEERLVACHLYQGANSE